MEIDTIRYFIKSLRYFPRKNEESSYLDAIGKPNDENIVSNLLAFYADSHHHHGFGTLIANALLRLGQCNEASSETCSYREYYTLNGNKIDIVIETNINHIVCIENKIYAALNNPLDDYQRTMEQHYKGKTIHYFILAPFPIHTDKANWKSITYNQLWCEVRKEYGYHLSSSNQKWNSLLTSLIEHTDIMNTYNDFKLSNKDRFILEHLNEIKEIINEKNNLMKKVDNFANYVYSDIAETVANDSTLSSLIKCWRWNSRPSWNGCQVFEIEKYHCAIDFQLSANEISLSWFKRKNEGEQIFNKVVHALLTPEHPEFKLHHGRLFLIETCRVTNDLLSKKMIEELKDKVLQYLSEIVIALKQIEQSVEK